MTGIVLSPKAHRLMLAALSAALPGGTVELADDTQRLVRLTVAACSADGEFAEMSGYGLAKGTPTRLACLDAAGDVLLSGPSSAVTLTPADIVPGALVTATGLCLRARA